jgi:hypothetical protein
VVCQLRGAQDGRLASQPARQRLRLAVQIHAQSVPRRTRSRDARTKICG